MTTPRAVERRTRNQIARCFAVFAAELRFFNGYSTVLIRVLSIDDNKTI